MVFVGDLYLKKLENKEEVDFS